MLHEGRWPCRVRLHLAVDLASCGLQNISLDQGLSTLHSSHNGSMENKAGERGEYWSDNPRTGATRCPEAEAVQG